MRIIGEHRQGDVNLASKGTGEVTIEETYTYIVEADSKTDNRLYVSQCPGLPIVGVSRSAGGLAVCKSISGQRRQENPIIWDFTCSFSSEFWGEARNTSILTLFPKINRVANRKHTRVI